MKHSFSYFVGLLVSGTKRAVAAAALICLVVAMASCRTPREVTKIETDTVIQKETEYIFLHDTIKEVEVRRDSVDRVVEKIYYVDSNGVVHEKEIEKLTRFVVEQNAYYEAKISQYQSTISDLEKKVSELSQTKEVQKDLSWFQKTMIGLGYCFIIALVGFFVYLYFRIKKK